MSTAEKSDRPERNQDLKFQSGPSAKDSVIFSGGDFSKNYGADQQRLQISDLHFDKFPTPATFACWKIRFKTEVCTCSQFPTEAMQWIKEVELVDSVDDLKSSCSVRGIQMPNSEVLDAKIAVRWTSWYSRWPSGYSGIRENRQAVRQREGMAHMELRDESSCLSHRSRFVVGHDECRDQYGRGEQRAA